MLAFLLLIVACFTVRVLWASDVVEDFQAPSPSCDEKTEVPPEEEAVPPVQGNAQVCRTLCIHTWSEDVFALNIAIC